MSRVFHPAKHHYHNFAVTRTVPSSFATASISKYASSDAPISLDLARSQHQEYVNIVRSVVPTIRLPTVEEHPDCVFVEDTVVAVNNRAVITQIGHVSRQGEETDIRLVLEQLGMEVWDMKSMNDQATCDGGDVLNTGRHMFVGLSDRTNQEGAKVLAEAFSTSQFPVLPVPLDTDNTLHLKSVITHLDERTLLAPTGPLGDAVLLEMDAESLGYTVLRLPDVRACNVVVVNGTVIGSTSSCEESQQILRQATEERKLSLQLVGTSEIEKSDGACTCCSVLLSL